MYKIILVVLISLGAVFQADAGEMAFIRYPDQSTNEGGDVWTANLDGSNEQLRLKSDSAFSLAWTSPSDLVMNCGFTLHKLFLSPRTSHKVLNRKLEIMPVAAYPGQSYCFVAAVTPPGYWDDWDPGVRIRYSIYRVSLKNGKAVKLLEHSKPIEHLAVGPSHVFYTTYTNQNQVQVRKVSHQGENDQVVFSLPNTGRLWELNDHPSCLAVDQTEQQLVFGFGLTKYANGQTADKNFLKLIRFNGPDKTLFWCEGHDWIDDCCFISANQIAFSFYNYQADKMNINTIDLHTLDRQILIEHAWSPTAIW